jgi:hypothetical protein
LVEIINHFSFIFNGVDKADIHPHPESSSGQVLTSPLKGEGREKERMREI